MAFTNLTDDLAIIQKLDDEPNDVGGLSAAELKAKFDEGGLTIQDFINNTLLSEVAASSAASNVGASMEAFPSVATVQDALDALLAAMQDITQGAVADGSITTAKLANLAVTTAKIVDLAVTTAKIANGAVTSDKLAGASVSTAKLVDGSVTANKLADGIISEGKVGSKAITTAKIADYAVTALQLAANAVGTAKIVDLAVTSGKIADGAVGGAKIADQTIERGKIADNAVSNTYTATIGTSWSGDAAPYTQNISIEGLLATDNPIIDIVPSDTYATAQAQMDAWAEIYKMVAGDGTLTIYANSATATAVPIQILCVRK